MAVKCGNSLAHNGNRAHHESVEQVRLCFSGVQVASLQEAFAVAAEICEHQMSASLCAGPGHYPADGPEENYSTSQLMSITSSQYHARGEGCPWDCSRCPGNVEADEAERAAEALAEMVSRGAAERQAYAEGKHIRACRYSGLPLTTCAGAIDCCCTPPPPEHPTWDGIYTLVREDGTHRTFRLRTQGAEEEFAPGTQIISYLSGTDNERDYTGFGFVVDGKVRVWSRFNTNTALVKDAKAFLANPDAALKEAHCFACHRKLTVPASVNMGLGPDCAKKAR